MASLLDGMRVVMKLKDGILVPHIECEVRVSRLWFWLAVLSAVLRCWPLNGWCISRGFQLKNAQGEWRKWPRKGTA